MEKEQLWQLRKEIALGSLYYSDYANSFGIETHAVCDFFDGFLDYVEEEMRIDIPDYNGNSFFDYLPMYDTIDYLSEWYACFDEDPLPIHVPEEAAA